MKRLICLALVLVLIFTLGACNKAKQTEEPQVSESSQKAEVKAEETKTDTPEPEPEPETINFDNQYDITIMQWGPRDVTEDDAVIALINEQFNINLTVERLLFKEYSANVELKVASGDLPDIFRNKNADAHIYQNLYEDDYLVNFSEYADKYDLMGIESYLEKPGMAQFAEAEGFFTLPSYKGPNKEIILYRSDWLAELGMESLDTLDDLKEFATKILENKLGGENTVPITIWLTSSIEQMLIAFTGANTWINVGGTWKYVSTVPEYKDGLKFVADLYQSGLLDREIFTQNETQANAKVINGQTGIIYTGADRYQQTFKATMAESNPEAELSMLPHYPSGPKGSVRYEYTGLGNPVLALKKDRDEDFVNRAVALLDFMHGEEGVQILNFGIEGTHYNMDGDARVTTEAYERDFIPGLGHLLAMTTDYSGVNELYVGVEKENYLDALENGVINPFESFNNEATLKVMPIITTTYEDWLIQFVVGEKSLDDDWDEYVEAMKAAGVDVLEQEVNAFAESKGIN